MRFCYYFLQYVLSFGYFCVMPLLLISRMILKKRRNLIASLIGISNGWLCVYATLFITYWGIDLLMAWYAQNQYEGYAFYYRSPWFSPSGFLFWLRFAIFPLALLFFGKKFRRSILLSTILILLMALTNERLVLYLVRFYRDYLPSSWHYDKEPPRWWENRPYVSQDMY